MSDEREKVAGQTSADLLDLVRSAEEAATIAARKRAVSATRDVAAPAGEFVDVGDDAVDAPSSFPPLHSPSTRPSPSSGGSEPPVSSAAPRRRPPMPPAIERKDGTPPAVGILLMLALAVGALVVVTR